MIDKFIVKWAIISLILRLIPLPIIGLIVYYIMLSFNGLTIFLVMPIIMFFAIGAYFITLTALAGLIAKLLGPIKEGTYALNSKEVDAWRAQLAFMELINWTQRIFYLPTSWFIHWFRIFLNAKISRKSIIIGKIHDPGLIEIGSNTIIGVDSLVLGHLINNNKVELKKVKIGNNCTIGAKSIIAPGAIIKDNTTIGIGCVVTKNKVLGPNKTYVGVPAKELTKK